MRLLNLYSCRIYLRESFKAGIITILKHFGMEGPGIVDYVNEHTHSESDLLQKLILDTENSMSNPHMLCGRIVGRFLKILIQSLQAKRVLEIGMFTGYSALSMAEALSEDGQLITCEIDQRPKAIAEKYFNLSPHGHKIRILFGPALETLKTLEGILDFVFIDADKRNYLNYYKLVLPMVRHGGLIVFDNALREGRVINPDTNDAKAIDETNKFILSDIRVENVVLTVRDGLNIVLKK